MDTSDSRRVREATAINLSIVVPCFNEELSLPALLDRMEAACRTFAGGNYEILLVNDGSRDRSWSCIRAFSMTRPGVIGINLTRNHGHQLAVTAGLAQARGQRVLVIDADLQDPPELIEQMMAKMDAGADVVYGRRRRRAKESRFKLTTASLFYRLLDLLSETEIPRDVGDFRLMKRHIVDHLNAMPEQDRFLRGMVAWLGGQQDEVIYDRPARSAGKSGYRIWQMLKLAASGLTSFSTVPLRLASLLAILGSILGLLMATYEVWGFVNGQTMRGWTSLALLVTIFSSAQLACIAILGSYVGRIFMQAKGRPLFMISEIVRSPLDFGLVAPSQFGDDVLHLTFADEARAHG